MEVPRPLPLNCPRCGTPLVPVVRGVSGDLHYYHCREHGRFWLDFDGRLRELVPGPVDPPTEPE